VEEGEAQGNYEKDSMGGCHIEMQGEGDCNAKR
jgi:hypothetical protein